MSTTNDTESSTGTDEGSPADETFGWTDESGEGGDASGGPAQVAREIFSQIQAAVETVAEKAAPVARDLQAKASPVAHDLMERAKPVARELGARAAGLAAAAGDKAGPIAHRAADMTADAGVKLAEKSRHVADDLRNAASDAMGGDARNGATDETASGPTGDEEARA